MTVCLMFQKPPHRRPDLTDPTRSSKRPRTFDLPAWVLAAPKQVESTAADKVVPLAADDLLTLAEAAAQLRISPRTLRRMVKAGDVTTIRIGRQLRFDHDTLWREINDLDSGRE